MLFTLYARISTFAGTIYTFCERKKPNWIHRESIYTGIGTMMISRDKKKSKNRLDHSNRNRNRVDMLYTRAYIYIKTGVWHIVCPDDLLSGSAWMEDACGKKTIKKKKKKESYKNQEFIIHTNTIYTGYMGTGRTT